MNIAVKSMSRRRHSIIMIFVMGIGCFLRLYHLGTSPGGINPDEALAGYESFCLLKDGMDSWGVSWPVYLTAWGSGMNVLLSLLAIPFIAIIGLCSLAVRLPQAIIGCLSLFCFYGMFEMLWNRKKAYVATAFLGLCPWHVLSSRLAVESGLLPGFLIFGLYFLLKSEKYRYAWIFSAVSFGLSLYTYAIVWPVLPFILILEAAILIRGKRWTTWKTQLPGFVAIIFVFAMPLLLFILVNHNIIPEMRIGFLSIPRLPEFRSDEVQITNIFKNIYVMARILIRQTDGVNLFASPVAGTMYWTSFPFFCIGGWQSVCEFYRTIRERRFEGGAVFFPFLLFGLVLGCFVEGNHSRLNLLHLAEIMMISLGICTVLKVLNRKWVIAVISVIYLFQAGVFTVNLFTDLEERRNITMRSGLEEGLKLAKEKSNEGDSIGVTGGLSYVQILFYDRTDPSLFRSSVIREKKESIVKLKSSQAFALEKVRDGVQ